MKPAYKCLAHLLIPMLVTSTAYPLSRKELGIDTPDNAISVTERCPFIPGCLSIRYDIGESPDGVYDMIESYYITGYKDGMPVPAREPFSVWRDWNKDGMSMNPDFTPQDTEIYMRFEGDWISLKETFEMFRENAKRRDGI